MKVHSISDIHNWLFLPVKYWVDQSQLHFNIFVGIPTLIVFVSIILFCIMVKKIGKQDERTAPIYLKSMEAGFVTLIVCEVVFPTAYLVNQFSAYKYGFALLAGLIYLLKAYYSENH